MKLSWWFVFSTVLLVSNLVSADYDEDEYEANEEDESVNCKEGEENRDGTCKLKEVLVIATDTGTPESSRVDDNKTPNTTATRRQVDNTITSSNPYEILYETSLNSGNSFAVSTSYEMNEANRVGYTNCPQGYYYNRGKCSRSVMRCPAGYSLQADECQQIEVGITDQLVCPQGFELRENTCYQTGCITNVAPPPVMIPQPQPTGPCSILQPQVVQPPPVIIRCPPGSRQEQNTCVIDVPTPPALTPRIEIRCPQGYRQEGNSCVYYVQPLPSQTFVVIKCPIGSRQQGNLCIFEPQLLEPPKVVVRCPYPTRLENGVCIQEVPAVPDPPVIVKCMPPSRLEGGRCVVNVDVGSVPPVMVKCMPPSRLEGDRCVVNVDVGSVPPVMVKCMPPSRLEGDRCVVNVDVGTVPPVIVKCMPPSRLEGDRCVVNVDVGTVALPKVVVRCPQGAVLEENVCVFNIPRPTIPRVVIICPQGAVLEDDVCVFYVNGKKPDVSGSLTENSNCAQNTPGVSIHNNNTLHAPVNVTSNNVNSISIHLGGCKEGQSEYTVIKNGVTEKVPCQEQASSQPPGSSCCNVVTPRLCTNTRGNWECGHRQYRRCGDFCKEDVVILKPIRSTYRRNMLVMPPPGSEINVSRRRGARVNCYGCLNGAYNCSPECFEYDCEGGPCAVVNQDQFCENYGGDGCSVEDGYFI